MYGKMAIEVIAVQLKNVHCIYLGAVSFLDPVCVFIEHFPTPLHITGKYFRSCLMCVNRSTIVGVWLE